MGNSNTHIRTPQTETAQPSTLRKIAGYLLKYAVPALISIGLCWLLFKNQDLGLMMETIRTECDFTWIGVALALNVVAMVFRALRWGIQLRALGIDVPFKVLLLSIFGTYAVNLVLPRLGEIWRTGYISQRQDKPFATVFGSMLGDRFADTLAVLIMAAITFLLASDAILGYFSQNSATLRSIQQFISSPWIWAVVVMLIAGLCVFMRLKTHSRLVNRLQHAIRELWKGFAVLVTMPGKWWWLLLTVMIWGAYFLSMMFAFRSFDFIFAARQADGLIVVLVTFVLSSISMGVPSNGGIGPWQWAVIFALGIYGVPAPQGGAFANVLLGATTLMQIVLGLLTFILIALDKRHHPHGVTAQKHNKTT